MYDSKILSFIQTLIQNTPSSWLSLTTYRLDIYNEKLAKTEFLAAFESLYEKEDWNLSSLHNLPTAYDYIRLGHPLSCILEWTCAKLNKMKAQNLISFSSRTMPLLAILRKNLLEKKNTQILYFDELPEFLNAEILQSIYSYNFQLKRIASLDEISKFYGSTVLLAETDKIFNFRTIENLDFTINMDAQFGSLIAVHGKQNDSYISEIQHVRRRESIAMTPIHSLQVLKALIEQVNLDPVENDTKENKAIVLDAIQEISGTNTKALIGSSGLSIQYAIMMGLVHHAIEKYPNKAIKFIVPPNCYGGTNDQARRVASCIDQVEILDLLVDGGNDMVSSLDTILDQLAAEDAIPYIIAEIPTNPRVEVPDLMKLKASLTKPRTKANGEAAILPVFILDQTFCPNVQFLSHDKLLASVTCISYTSGSKFPSGGLCTAGYCTGNKLSADLLDKVEIHLKLCDNEASQEQMEVLAEQLPSMQERIHLAYLNTRSFVNFIQKTLPAAKINFVEEELAKEGFTPSVFSLDLPTKGINAQEKEANKRVLNHQLINLMIAELPNEAKHCVSYGQLKGSYWTIPATSTQGTTKEGDKDYIVRVSLSPNLDLELHQKLFLKFVEKYI
ncbi:MAG: cystathionine beta-synthase [Chitinophagales bacterium]|nr:cystathionine beta-synthase [Chitinophagales bacterium]